jgi:hypothetical protein
MTMKVSKGLEFAAVALPDVGHMPAPGEDEKEAARVFYVAPPSATQRLVMGVGVNRGGFGVRWQGWPRKYSQNGFDFSKFQDMTFNFSIPTATEPLNIAVNPGSSIVIVGANGGGKTRLAVHVENSLQISAHRISAHRALALNPSVAKISERKALSGLRTGYAESENIGHRLGSRWQGNMAVTLLNDFDFLVQALFADQSNKSLETHQKVRAGNRDPVDPTKFERLQTIWSRLLPHPERVNDFATPCFMNLRCRVVLFQSDSFAWAVGWSRPQWAWASGKGAYIWIG